MYKRQNKYKRDHNLIDFNDLEANALKLLQPQYGIANLLYNQLKEIMIDEYQDTNQIQETLINKIADFKDPKINRFMVGDMTVSYTHLDVYKRQPFFCLVV